MAGARPGRRSRRRGRSLRLRPPRSGRAGGEPSWWRPAARPRPRRGRAGSASPRWPGRGRSASRPGPRVWSRGSPPAGAPRGVPVPRRTRPSPRASFRSGRRRPPAREALGRQRVGIADQQVRHDPERRGLLPASVRGDDEADLVGPACPGRVQGGAAGHVAIGDDEGPPGACSIDQKAPPSTRQRCTDLDSLRRHDPDQVPRVCGSTPHSQRLPGAPLSVFCCPPTLHLLRRIPPARAIEDVSPAATGSSPGLEAGGLMPDTRLRPGPPANDGADLPRPEAVVTARSAPRVPRARHVDRPAADASNPADSANTCLDTGTRTNWWSSR